MKSYIDLLGRVTSEGIPHADRTGVGTVSRFGDQIMVDLEAGFPLLTTKRMPPRVVFEELKWFLLGRTDVDWLQERRVSIWDEWATAEQCARFGRHAGDLGPVYGHAWRRFGAPYDGPIGWWTDAAAPATGTVGARPTPDGMHAPRRIDGIGGVDQIRRLCEDLRRNPGSRRLIVIGYDPVNADAVALPPCHSMFQCKVHAMPDGTSRLDLHLYQRSADVFLGVPFNIASYAMLTHLLAHAHGMVPGRFIHSFGDVHLYRNHMEQATTQMARDPRPLPRLRVADRLRGGGLDAVLGATWEDLVIEGYDPHPAIKAPVAV